MPGCVNMQNTSVQSMNIYTSICLCCNYTLLPQCFLIAVVMLSFVIKREYRATMAEENLHHSGPVYSFDLKISTIVALFPLITLLMTPP